MHSFRGMAQKRVSRVITDHHESFRGKMCSYKSGITARGYTYTRTSVGNHRKRLQALLLGEDLAEWVASVGIRTHRTAGAKSIVLRDPKSSVYSPSIDGQALLYLRHS